MHSPPFAELIYLGVVGRDERAVARVAGRYAELLRQLEQVEVLGPAPYPVPRVNDEWRYRIALKAGDAESLRVEIRERLQPLARADRNTRLVVNVDP